MEIPKLDDLLKGHINGKIIKQNISRLTAAGENYGSLMLKVDVTVKNNDGKEEVISTVAKCVPVSKKMQEIFSTHVTFKNEIGWYQEAIPAMIEFQKVQGIENVADFFMKIYGTRLSLNPDSKEVDQDGVILCENLNVRGFKNVDRRIGFNLKQTTEVIKKMATFHAMSLALKLKKPEMFNKKVKNFLIEGLNDKHSKNFDIYRGAIEVVKDNPETSHLASRFENTIKSVIEQVEVTKSSELWFTAIHTDFWVNNIMIKEENENLEIIILDLQCCVYASVAQDLLFFLGTSVENTITAEYFDDFIKLYYEELISNLELLKVDTTEFSYQSFEEELKLKAAGQLIHTLFMIPVILAEKNNVHDVNVEEFDPMALMKMFQNITENHKKKWIILAEIFAKHNWI